MSLNSEELVLPRPGGAPSSTKNPIPGPTEAAFTKTFGALLPPAQYLTTAVGKAAYYKLLPLHPISPGTKSPPLDRVLFIHGVQTPALGMFPLVRTLQNSFPSAHFVQLDLWGHGLSDTPMLPHEPSLFHGLIDALMDHLGWHSAHLVGYSLGGALTVGYVVSRPIRVESFTLIAPAGLIKSSEFTAEEMGHLHGDDQAAAGKWALEYLEGGQLVVPTDWKTRVERGEVVAPAIREWEMREHPGHWASVISIMRDGGIMDNEAEYIKAVQTGIPSLAVLGEMDDVCTEKKLKDVGFKNFAVVPQGGHTIVRDRVPEVAALIDDFWTELNNKK